MNEILRAWLTTIETRKVPQLSRELSARGERNKHMGPRWERASASVRAVPSDRFQCTVAGAEEISKEEKDYAEWFLFGVLDVLVPHDEIPIANTNLIVSDVVVHPVDSSRRAFRHAGRDAGRKIVDALKAARSGMAARE